MIEVRDNISFVIMTQPSPLKAPSIETIIGRVVSIDVDRNKALINWVCPVTLRLMQTIFPYDELCFHSKDSELDDLTLSTCIALNERIWSS